MSDEWRDFWQFPEKTWIPAELRDFKVYLHLLMRHQGMVEPTCRQREAADYLQDGPQELMVMAYRGFGKSFITGALVSWILLWWPDKKGMVVSASQEHAKNFCATVRGYFDTFELLRHLKPGADARRDAVTSFDVKGVPFMQDPSMRAIGIFGQMAGAHVDFLIFDDMEIPDNSDTPSARFKLSERSREFAALTNPGARQIGLGTPQSEQTVYSYLPDRGFDIRIWPARFPQDTDFQLGYLAPAVQEDLDRDPGLATRGACEAFPGMPVDPERYGEEVLHSKLGQYARSGFSLQFMLDTRISDALRRPLRISDMICFEVNPDIAPRRLVHTTREDYRLDIPHLGPPGQFLHSPAKVGEGEWIEYRGKTMAIDPSGRGADETAYAIVGIAGGLFYVLDFGGLAGGYEDPVLEELAKMAEIWKVNKVVVEDNFGDGMFQTLLAPFLRNRHPCAMEGVRHGTQKEARIIEVLEPLLVQKRIVMSSEALHKDYNVARQRVKQVGDRWQQYALTYQMTRLTKDRDCLAHDDRLDALAMACADWQGVMALSKDEALNRQVDDGRDEELRNWMEAPLFGGRGQRQQADNWNGTNQGCSRLRR